MTRPVPRAHAPAMDLLTMIDPLMTSPLLYPLLSGLSTLDGVFPMIPSEAAVLASGVFAHAGVPSLVLVIVATALGVFAGDHLAYGLSRSVFGPRLIGRSRRLSRAVDAAGRQLGRNGSLLIVTSRFLPGGRVTMNAACGTAGLPLSRFTPASAIAALAWATYTAGLGFLGGAAFVANPVLGLAVGIGLSFAVGGAVELARRVVARRRGRSAHSGRQSARRTVSSSATRATQVVKQFVQVHRARRLRVDLEQQPEGPGDLDDEAELRGCLAVLEVQQPAPADSGALGDLRLGQARAPPLVAQIQTQVTGAVDAHYPTSDANVRAHPIECARTCTCPSRPSAAIGG